MTIPTTKAKTIQKEKLTRAEEITDAFQACH